MKAQTLEAQNGSLSSEQLRALRKFKRKMNEDVPDYSIVWVRPFNENIIRVGVEPQKKLTYRKSLRAAELAIEVGDEMGIVIIF